VAAPPEDNDNFSVERFDPRDGGPIMRYEHVHRYAACAEVVRGKRVLDVASGEGYGASLLARTAKSVVGSDIDEDVVGAARGRYARDGLEFVRADMFDLPFENGAFDVVTCFEAIEHVEHPGIALDEIARVLAPSGTAIVSTPDKAVYSDAEDYTNEFHLHEFYEAEFREELAKRFASVLLLGQRVRAGSELVALDGALTAEQPTVGYLPDPGASEAAVTPSTYLIAVCRNGDAAGASGVLRGVLLDGSDRLTDEYVATVHELADRREELWALRVEMTEVRAYAAELSRQYELAMSREKALGDELLRVTRDSETRAVYILSLEEDLTALKRSGEPFE